MACQVRELVTEFTWEECILQDTTTGATVGGIVFMADAETLEAFLDAHGGDVRHMEDHEIREAWMRFQNDHMGTEFELRR